MRNLNDYLDFFRNNLPPCLPGDSIYWIDSYGNIKKVERDDFSIVLTSDFKWYILPDGENELIEPNKDEYYCLTFEDAVKMRNSLNFELAIFKPSSTGHMVVSDSCNNKEQLYSFYKKISFKGSILEEKADSIPELYKIYKDIDNGSVILSEPDEYQILISEGKCISVFLSPIDQLGESELKNCLD